MFQTAVSAPCTATAADFARRAEAATLARAALAAAAVCGDSGMLTHLGNLCYMAFLLSVFAIHTKLNNDVIVCSTKFESINLI